LESVEGIGNGSDEDERLSIYYTRVKLGLQKEKNESLTNNSN
jgi:hypothetical protein